MEFDSKVALSFTVIFGASRPDPSTSCAFVPLTCPYTSVYSSTPSSGGMVTAGGQSIEARTAEYWGPKSQGRGGVLGRRHHQLRGLGERRKRPQQGLERSPSRNRIWCILAVKSDIWWQLFFYNFAKNQLTKFRALCKAKTIYTIQSYSGDQARAAAKPTRRWEHFAIIKARQANSNDDNNNNNNNNAMLCWSC